MLQLVVYNVMSGTFIPHMRRFLSFTLFCWHPVFSQRNPVLKKLHIHIYNMCQKT